MTLPCSSGVRVSSWPPSTRVGTADVSVPGPSGGALGTAGQPRHWGIRPVVPTTVAGENGANGARPRPLRAAVAWRSRAAVGGLAVSHGSADSLQVVARNTGTDTPASSGAEPAARVRRSSGAGSPRSADAAAAGSWPRRIESRSPSASVPKRSACDALARRASPPAVITRPRSGRRASRGASRATDRAPPLLTVSRTRGWAESTSRPKGSVPVMGLGESMIWRTTEPG